MKLFRKFFGAFALMFGLGIGNAAHAGIPVIDGAAIAQAVLQVQSWAQQYQQMVQQIHRGSFDHLAILRQGDHRHRPSMAEKPCQTYSIPRISLAGTRRVLGKSRKRAA